MAISSSPAALDTVVSSTYRKPDTTEPGAPLGVIVTVIVPWPPGSTDAGVNAGGWASTPANQWSPVDDVIAGSNACVWATAAMLTGPGNARVSGSPVLGARSADTGTEPDVMPVTCVESVGTR